MSVIEKPEKPIALKRAVKNSELHINGVPKHIVSVNNNVKKEGDNKPEQDQEIGLPPQAKEYIKCPDYDWF